MKKETFYSAFAEGIASIVAEIAGYPISRFNLTLQGKKRDKWSPYDFVDSTTEAKSIILTSFAYGFTFDVAGINVYSAFRNKLGFPHKLCVALSGSLGEFAAELVAIPLINLSKKLQIEKSTNFESSLINLCKPKGYKGLYEGFWPTVITSVPYFFVKLPLYDHLKSKVLKEKKKYQTNDCIWVSVVATAIGNLIANPIDVLTSNLQKGKKELCYQNYADEFKRIIQSDDAIPALYKNLSHRNVVGILGATVYVAVYEKLNSMLQRKKANF